MRRATTSRLTRPASRRAHRPTSSTSPTATRSSCESRRSRSASATRRCACSPTTAPSPARRCACARGREVVVDVANDGDLDATVHWHGLRLDNRYDGTHETQAPIPVGGTFTYRLDFPDPGVYWYHPHIREDYGQELGLYGNILVVPAERRLLAAGAPRAAAHARRRPDRGREDRAVRRRDDVRRDGPLRQRHARRRRDRPRRSAHSPARSSAST